MKEKISQLAKEKFEYEKPLLQFSVETLALAVEVSGSVQATFQITNSRGMMMKGLLYSTDPRLTFVEHSFIGQSANITVIYDAVGEIDATMVRQGMITVVSNYGEYELPFEVQMEAPYIETTHGKVRDLYQFTELAKKDLSEAVAVFKMPEFRKLMVSKQSDRRLYDGLLQSPVTAQAMEEFLIAMRYKMGVALAADSEEKQYDQLATSMSDAMEITASEWGYVEAEVSTDCDFIVLGQTTISSDDFLEGSCMLPYTIDYSKLHEMRERAHIVIETRTQRLVVAITVTKVDIHSERVKDTPAFLGRKLELELVETYLKFRMNQLTREAYSSRLWDIVQSIQKVKPSFVEKLWLAHYYMVTGNAEKLDWIMDYLAKHESEMEEESKDSYDAYQYLRVLYTKNGIQLEETIHLFESGLEAEHTNWKRLWYLLYIDKSYEEDQEKRVTAVLDMLKAGVASPVLYYEAAFAYNKEPHLLKGLSREERQVMHWVIRNRFLSRELASQYVFVASRVKKFDPMVLKDLMIVYEYMQSTDCLQVILRMLITGQMTDPSYFIWYELGVKNNLKLTELYEYYMYSIKEGSQVVIDRTVLLYFVYDNHLPEAKKAYLYAYILKHKEENASIYRTYLRQIESFTRKMALKGALNQSLITLYQQFITPEVIDEELARALPQILFKYELVCKNKKIAGIVVRQEEWKDEMAIPLDNGRCFLTMPTSHATIYLLDANKNRYVGEGSYTISRPFYKEELVAACVKINKQNRLLLLDRKEALFRQGAKSYDAAEYMMIVSRLLEMDEISKEFKNRQFVTMMEYYNEQADFAALDAMLSGLKLECVDGEDIPVVADYLIMRGQFDKAYRLIRSYGYEIVSAKRLQELVSYLIKTHLMTEKEGAGSPAVTAMCEQVLEQGIMDHEILTYLALHFENTTARMYECYHLLKKEEIEVSVILERLLAQMLFSETMLEESKELFFAFYEENDNKMLCRAYLNYMAYRYVRFEETISEALCEIIKRESFYHESRVGILAVLKFNAKKDVLGEEERKLLDYNLHKLIGEGIVLPFFKDYADRFHLPDEICSHTFVEYKGSPNEKVTICYCNKEGNPVEKAFMKNMFEGIFVKEFVLFYGEELQYYMEVEDKNHDLVTTGAQVLSSFINSGARNHFQELNQMSKACYQKDSTSLQEMLCEYAIEDYITSSLFTPL